MGQPATSFSTSVNHLMPFTSTSTAK